MGVVNSKKMKAGARVKLCELLARMAEAELTDQTKHDLTMEVTTFFERKKSFEEIAEAYGLKITQKIENDDLWVTIFIPNEFCVGRNIPASNKENGQAFVNFLIRSTTTKPGEKMKGIPVLSKTEAAALYQDILEDAQEKALKKFPELKEDVNE